MSRNAHHHKKRQSQRQGGRRLERFHEPLATRGDFLSRMMWFVAASLIMVAVSLAIGVLGYHFFNNLSWIDSILNASMILGGMGPVAELHSRAGKLFASAYALFSGLAIIGAASVMLTPIVHRLMHKFHMQLDDDDNGAGDV